MSDAADLPGRVKWAVSPAAAFSTNLLVHRDYADGQPATIQAHGNCGVAFLNPGRIEERVAVKLKFDAHGQFEPVRELTSPRNRALCDIFYGGGGILVEHPDEQIGDAFAPPSRSDTSLKPPAQAFRYH